MLMIDNKFRGMYTASYRSDEDPDDEFTCFECDELIAPVILELNRRGYKTKFSCSGHIYEKGVEFDDNSYIMNMEKEEYAFVDDKDWSHPYVYFDSHIKHIPNIENLPEGWKCVYTPVNPFEQNKLFKEIGTTEPSSPPAYKYRIVLRYDFTEELVFSKFFKKNGDLKYYSALKFICRIMEDLYKWVLKLPVYEE